MALVIVDASVTCAWCFPDEQTPYTQAVLECVSDDFDGIVPAIWAYEVRNVALMGLRRGRITQGMVDVFFDSLRDLGFVLVQPPSYDAVFSLAQQHGLTVYDAAYLDLATRNGLPLATLDKRLLDAAQRC